MKNTSWIPNECKIKLHAALRDIFSNFFFLTSDEISYARFLIATISRRDTNKLQETKRFIHDKIVQ